MTSVPCPPRRAVGRAMLRSYEAQLKAGYWDSVRPKPLSRRLQHVEALLVQLRNDKQQDVQQLGKRMENLLVEERQAQATAFQGLQERLQAKQDSQHSLLLAIADRLGLSTAEIAAGDPHMLLAGHSTLGS